MARAHDAAGAQRQHGGHGHVRRPQHGELIGADGDRQDDRRRHRILQGSCDPEIKGRDQTGVTGRDMVCLSASSTPAGTTKKVAIWDDGRKLRVAMTGDRPTIRGAIRLCSPGVRKPFERERRSISARGASACQSEVDRRTLYRVLLQVVIGTVSATCFMSSASTMHSAYQPAGNSRRSGSRRATRCVGSPSHSSSRATQLMYHMLTVRFQARRVVIKPSQCPCTIPASMAHPRPGLGLWLMESARVDVSLKPACARLTKPARGGGRVFARTCDPEVADGAEVDVVVGVHCSASQDACQTSRPSGVNAHF